MKSPFHYLSVLIGLCGVVYAYVLALPPLWQITVFEWAKRSWLERLWHGLEPLARLGFAPQALAIGTPANFVDLYLRPGYGIWTPFIIELAALAVATLVWHWGNNGE